MEVLRSVKYEELLEKAVKYAKDNQAVVGVSAAVALLGGIIVLRRPSMKRDGNDYQSSGAGVRILNNDDHTLKREDFAKSIDGYTEKFAGARESTGAITSKASIAKREAEYADMVNSFYNLVTDFYEWGWGQSFHFGPRFHNEGFVESIKRAEYYLCSRLGMVKGMKVLDVGCGVGGPMRNMAVFSGSSIDGITINQYQVNIGNKYNAQNGLSDTCKLTQGDFQNIPWAAGHFDAAYEIEATCHSPDKAVTFTGVARVLKQGGLFAGYEWVMTDKYDPKNADHVRIKEGIEVGNGLPTLPHYSHVGQCLEKAGFEVIDEYDANRGVHSQYEIPWYDTLNGKMTLSGFRMTHLGRMCTHTMVWVLETLTIAPPGTVKVSALLNATAIDLVEGGQLEIFTPSYFFIGRKR